MSNDPILHAILMDRAERQRQRISTRLRHIANRVERELNDLRLPGEEKPIFALFVMQSGAAQYVSNGNRDDIKTVVGSVLRRWDDPAYASIHVPHHEKDEATKQAEKDDPV